MPYHLRSITHGRTDRQKALENATLRTVRAMRSVVCWVLPWWVIVRPAHGFLARPLEGSYSRVERLCSGTLAFYPESCSFLLLSSSSHDSPPSRSISCIRDW